MDDRFIKLALDAGLLNYVDHETPRHYFINGHADLEDVAKFAKLVILENRQEAANKIEQLRGVLQQIADIEHEDIPVPQTSNEGVTWTVLAMAVGLAEKALKEGE
jgi:hypothetical protein